jgi:hypothetical protein
MYFAKRLMGLEEHRTIIVISRPGGPRSNEVGYFLRASIIVEIKVIRSTPSTRLLLVFRSKKTVQPGASNNKRRQRNVRNLSRVFTVVLSEVFAGTDTQSVTYQANPNCHACHKLRIST